MNPSRAACVRAFALQRAAHADTHVPTLAANIQAAMRRALHEAAAQVRRNGTLKIDSAMRAQWAKGIWRAMHGRMFYMADHGYQLAGRELGMKGKSHGVGRVLFHPHNQNAVGLPARRMFLGKASQGGVEIQEDKSAFIQDTDWRGLDKWVNTTAESASATLGKRMLSIFENAAAFRDPDTGRGRTPAEISQQLLTVGDDMTRERADMLARTGAIYGYNEGAMQRYADDGVPVMEWLCADDDLTCPICVEFSGLRVSPKDNFFDAGETVDGGMLSMKLKYAVKHPPAHPNCRCTVIPIVDEGQLDVSSNDVGVPSGPIAQPPTPVAPAPSIPQAISPQTRIGKIISVDPMGSLDAAVHDGLAAIDSVHTLPATMPPIPVRLDRNSGVDGGYLSVPLYDTARRIDIDEMAKGPEFTLAHEVGHFIDHKGFDGVGFATERKDPILDEWKAAVAQSDAFKTLKDLETRGLAGDPSIRAAGATFYMRDDEAWARSYAQFIAQKSGNKAMANELDRRRDRHRPGSVYYPTQWDDADFKPIATAIENILKARGMMP